MFTHNETSKKQDPQQELKLLWANTERMKAQGPNRKVKRNQRSIELKNSQD